MGVVIDEDYDTLSEQLRAVIPRAARAVAAAEVETIAILSAVGKEEASNIQADIHDRSGTLDRSIGVRVRRVAGGGVMLRYGSVKPQTFQTRKGRGRYMTSKQDVYYDHFVDQGTGIYGPRKALIKRRGLIRMGGIVFPPSGRGQKPQRMFQRSAERFSQKSLAIDEAVDDRLTAAIERTV
jgi:hypothetical protein